MDLKSGLKRAGLWMTVAIGGICAAAFLLTFSHEHGSSGSSVAIPHVPAQSAAVQDLAEPDIQRGERASRLKEGDTARIPEAITSIVDAPMEIAASSTSPLACAQDQAGEADEAEEEDAASGGPDEARKFRNLQLQNEDGKIPVDGYERAQNQLRAMKFRQTLEAKSKGKPEGLDIAGINPASWAWLGPGNVGGRIRSIVIDPVNPNNMFVGSVAGGIWRTNNAGVSWAPVNDFLANLAVSTMVIDPTNSNIIYAGTGESFNGASPEGEPKTADGRRGDGVFKSIDGGTTWTQLARTKTSDPTVCATAGPTCPWSYVNRLAISPNGGTILAATIASIWRSTDGGATWTLAGGVVGSLTDMDFDPTNSQLAVSSGGSSSWFSTNGGQNWSQANFRIPPNPNPTPISGRVELAYAPSNPSIVYASVDQNQGDVFRSTDGGQNFTQVNTGNNLLATQGSYGNIIWVNPLDPTFVIVGGVTLWRSTNSGTNFTQISTPTSNANSAHPDQHMIVASPGFDNNTNKTVYFSNDGGIFRADDVSAASQMSGWTKLNNNLGITQFYGAAANSAGVILAGAQDNGTVRYTGNSALWDGGTGRLGGDGGYVAADLTDNNSFYAEYVTLGLVRSTDGGATGGYIYCNPVPIIANGGPCTGTGILDAFNGANFIAPFVLDPNEPNRMLAGGLSVWRSNDIKNTNSGQNNGLPTWTAIKPPIAPRPVVPPATPNSTPPLSTIVVSPNNSDFMVVGYNDGQIYLTFNGTAAPPNWSRIDTGSPATPARFVTRLVIDETRSPNWIYATFGGFAGDNVYCTKDLGGTWTDVSGSGATSIPSAPIRSLLINPIHRDYLYVGTEIGVFASADGGLTWGLPQDGPANVSVDELFWYDGRLAAATFGRGIYESGPLFISNGGSGSGGGGGTGISCPGTGSGYWSDPLTWPSGQVPLSTDDVAVVCPIKIGFPAQVRNLRVNSILTLNSSISTSEDIGNFGTIQPDISLPGNADISCGNLSNSGTMNNIHVMTASGDVVNGNTLSINTLQSKGLRNAGSLNAVNVTVNGNFDNSGSMIGTGALSFTGGPTHDLSGAGQIKFAGGGFAGGQTVKFLSDMTFDIGEFNSGATIDFNGKTLNFIGNSYSDAGSVLGTGTLRLAPTLGTVVLGGNAPGVNLTSGLANYQSGGTFTGPLTVGAGATFRLNAAAVNINGDATINGAITRETVFGGNGINFFGGTFTNNGGVTADIVRFNPSGPTPLSQNIAGAGVWSGGAIAMGSNLPGTPSTVTLQNDVTFAMDEMQISYSFNLNGHVLTYTGIGSPGVSVGGLLAGPGTLRMQPSAGTPIVRMFPGATWNADLKIASGTVRTNSAFGNFVVSAPLTVDAGATLRMDGVGNYFGNTVVNNGTINMMNGSSALQFRGSTFTNNGTIDATNVYFLPLAPQQMDLAGGGAWTGAGTLYLDTAATTRFTTDVTYGSGNLQTYGPLQGVDPSVFSVPCTVPWTGPGEVTGNIRRTNLAACPGTALRFGSPFTTITFNSGTPPSDVLVSSVSSPLVPAGFPNAVQRLYTITPTGGSGYSATLRLHYLDSELNGNDENTLELFRFDGSSWTQQGATNRDTVNNWVEYAGVTQFSPWAIAGTLPITPSPTSTDTPMLTPTPTSACTPVNSVNATAIAIPDSGPGSPYPSNIAVSGLSGNVYKVAVKLNGLNHTFPYDIDVMLVGPGGQNAIIMSDVGGNNAVSGVSFTLDSDAAADIPSPPVNGATYRPTNTDLDDDVFPAPAPPPAGGSALTTFVGTSPNGTWSLYVVDDASGDMGSFASGWEINITTDACGGTPTGTGTPTTTATNTPTPAITSMLSGTITYGNAIGNPVPPRFVKNVSVASTVGSPAVGPVITGTPGTYVLTGFGAGSYTIRPTKPGGASGAITSNDAARVAQGVSGLAPFVSMNQKFASDASGNGTVSSNDAALIARFAAGLPGAGIVGQWKFFTGNLAGSPSGPVPTPPYNDSRTYASVASSLTGEDYVALLVGEASGNYNPATHPRPAFSRQKAEDSSSERSAVGGGPDRGVEVNLPQMGGSTDKEIVVPVSVAGAAGKEIISYEFDLRYDPAVIQPLENVADLLGTVSRGLMVLTNPNEPGLLRVVVYGPMPIDGDGVLLNLRFTVVGKAGSESPLTWERILFNEDELGTTVTDGKIKVD